MAPPSTSKNPKKSKKKTSNLTDTPLPQQQQPVYRPTMADMPMYSPAHIHYPSMYGYYMQQPSPNFSQTQVQPQVHTQSLAEDTPFNPPYLTQTPTHNTQPPQHTSNFEPRRLLDESTESSNEETNDAPPEVNSDPDPEVEIEFEAEPEPTRAGKGKAKSLLWSVPEVKALAESWLEVSEDAAIGTNQDTSTWKHRVWRGFCSRMKKNYRNQDQCYSKWRALNKVVQAFNGVWMDINRKPPSGMSELDIINLAKEMYKTRYSDSFRMHHEVFWRTVKDHDKWLALESADDFTGIKSKRSKTSSTTHSQTSSDARTFIDLNEADPYEEPRPDEDKTGRDKTKAKRKVKGSGGGSGSGVGSGSASGDPESLEGFNVAITNLAESRRLKEKNRAFKLMLTDESTVPEDARPAFRRAKADLMKTYKWDKDY